MMTLVYRGMFKDRNLVHRVVNLVFSFVYLFFILKLFVCQFKYNLMVEKEVFLFCSSYCLFVACVAEKKAKGIKASTSREESSKSKGKSAAKSAGRKGKSGGGASNVVEEEEGKEFIKLSIGKIILKKKSSAH